MRLIFVKVNFQTTIKEFMHMTDGWLPLSSEMKRVDNTCKI